MIGIDPGTVSVDLLGLNDGGVFLDLSIPTAEALASPSRIPDLLEQYAPLDLVVGPSGYGLPPKVSREASVDCVRSSARSGVFPYQSF